MIFASGTPSVAVPQPAAAAAVAAPTARPLRRRSVAAIRKRDATPPAARGAAWLLARVPARELAVELVRARPGERRHDAGRRPRPRPRLNQAAQGVDGEGDVGAVRHRLRGGDDDDDLAADLVAKPPGELTQRSAGDLLVQLRQLAADGRPALGRKRRERSERLGQPARRFERHDRVGNREEAFELAAAPRQESDEPPARDRQRRGHEGRDDRRGARQDLDLQPALDALADEPVARVGDRGRARVGRQRDACAALDPLRQRGSPLGLVAVVVGDQLRSRDPEPLVEQPGAAGVLACDQVGLYERLARPGREVLEVADRGRADGEAARHQPRASERSSAASAAAPIIPASGPNSASRTATCWLIGGRARARSSPRAGSSSRSPATLTPPPITITSGSKMLAKVAMATPRWRPIVARAPIAASSPACADAVTDVPSIAWPPAASRPSAESGSRSAAAAPSRASACPDAKISTQPWFGQLPWHGGPFSSITTWPSSAPAPLDPRKGLPLTIRPPPIPVPIVSITAFVAPRAAP